MMSEVRKSLGAGAIALLPIACCIGLPLLAAGVGAAALVWGGAVAGGVLVATLAAVLLLRRRARAAACPRPLLERASPHELASEAREEVVQR
jgi:hypothetical protein